MMKRACSRDELVGNCALLLVGAKCSILRGGLFFNGIESRLHLIGSCITVSIVERDLKQLAVQKSCLERGSLAVR